MKKCLALFMGVVMTFSLLSQSELKVFEDWSTTAGTQHFFYKNVTKTDGSGNVYVAGATMNAAGNYDILVAKYSSGGVQQWVQQYNGGADYHDLATSLFIDGSGNVYITGAVTDDGVNFFSDLIIIKYNSSGTQQWVYTYDGAANLLDSGADLEVDGSGNVYATGTSYNGSYNADVLVVKVNSSGAQQWATLYDYTSHLDDAGIKVKAGPTTIYVTGAVQATSTAYAMGVLSLSASTGSITGVVGTGSGSSAMDVVSDMQEIGGNIYIAGGAPTVSCGYDYCIIKFDSYLNIVWQKTYNGADSLDDVARGLKVDEYDNVYVTGFSKTTSEGSNYLTQKYNSSGTLIWTTTFNDTLNGDDDANALELSVDNEVYITGNAVTAMNGIDYYTIKYDSAGVELWNIYFDGEKHLNDKATNMAIDSMGNVIVTGESEISPGVFEYATVKYVEQQTINPVDFGGEPTPSSFLYYANKGQLITTDSTFVPDVHFYTNSTYPAYYFQDDTMSMLFAHIDTVAASNDTLHRIDMGFENCNDNVRIYPLERKDNYLNYFLAHCPQGVTEIFGNQKLVVHDLYDDIDLVYSSNQIGMKYYFVVKPGGDPDDIKMQYVGATSTNLASNILSIRGIIDTISFDRPFMYQIDSGNDTIANSDYLVNWHNYTGNKYGVDVHSYDSSKVLIIEIDQGNGAPPANVLSSQSLEWSTFMGGVGLDMAFDVTISGGSNPNIFVAGRTTSAVFLAQVGFTSFLYNNQDAFVAKFTNAAVNVWVNYLGGSSVEYGRGVAVDKLENVYVVGSTQSMDFPNNTNAGINYSSLQGAQDGFYVEIKNSGVAILCDSYIGGASGAAVAYGESANGIALSDVSGSLEIYIVGVIQGDGTGCPFQTSGNYNQTTTSVGDPDNGFIMKLNASNANQWFTLVGGEDREWFYDVVLRPSNGNPVIVGYTEAFTNSADACDVPTDGGLPFCDNGGLYYSQNPGGGHDVIILEFDRTNQSLIWATPFGGSGKEGSAFSAGKDASIAITDNDDVYIAGTYLGDGSSFPLLNSQNGGIYNRSWDLTGSFSSSFIARFNSDREQVWTSYIGEGGTYLYGICTDGENVFLTGFTTATSVEAPIDYCDVPSTDVFPICDFTGLNYLETNPTGSQRIFIHSFDKYDNMKWSTIFGSDYDNRGYDLSASGNKLYLVGYSTQNNTLWEYDNVSPLDYYKTTISGSYDATIAKFDISSVVGISEQQDVNGSILTYPNPSASYVYLELDKEIQNETLIEVFDAMGKNIFQQKYKLLSKSTKLDIQLYAKGIYFVKITSGNIIYNSKFIKQ